MVALFALLLLLVSLSTSFVLPNTFPVTLGPGRNKITLDYGKLVAGLTTYKVKAAGKDFHLHVVYSETKAYSTIGDYNNLWNLQHTAHWTRVVDQSFSASTTTVSEDDTQGGYRFQYIELTTPNTNVTIEEIKVEIEYYQGEQTNFFKTSDPVLDKMWQIGVNTVRVNMWPAHTLKDQFQVTDQGIRVPSMKGGMYYNGYNWAAYIYEINVMPLKGGFSFGMGGQGDQFNIQLNAGADGRLNQLTLYKGIFWWPTKAKTFTLAKPVQTNTWIKAKCAIDMNNDATVTIGDEVFTYPKVDGTNKAITGTISLYAGASQDFVVNHAIVVNAYGVTLFQSDMKTREDMQKFYAATNRVPLLVDGTKRDRFLWSGDLLTSAPALYYSFNAPEYLRETARILIGYRNSDGLANGYYSPTAPPPPEGPTDSSMHIWSYSYAICMFKVMDDYYMNTADSAFVQSQWPILNNMLQYFIKRVDSSGRLIMTNSGLTLDWANNFWGTNKWVKLQALYINALDVSAKFSALFDSPSQADRYNQLAHAARAGLDTMYDMSRGFYPASQDFPNLVAQDALGMVITYGKVDSGRAANVLRSMDHYLKTPGGYLANYPNNGQYSPYTAYFHAEAAFESSDYSKALDVLKSTYGRMIDPSDREYTGATWERIKNDGNDESGQVSHAHAWSAGVTALLSKYVLGLRTVQPGYKTWLVRPGFVVSKASGAVATVQGNFAINWVANWGLLYINISAPAGTSGSVQVPFSGCAYVDGIKVPLVQQDSMQAVNLNGGTHNIKILQSC